MSCVGSGSKNTPAPKKGTDQERSRPSTFREQLKIKKGARKW